MTKVQLLSRLAEVLPNDCQICDFRITLKTGSDVEKVLSHINEAMNKDPTFFRRIETDFSYMATIDNNILVGAVITLEG